jgi:hypothetical protein
MSRLVPALVRSERAHAVRVVTCQIPFFETQDLFHFPQRAVPLHRTSRFAEIAPNSRDGAARFGFAITTLRGKAERLASIG